MHDFTVTDKGCTSAVQRLKQVFNLGATYFGSAYQSASRGSGLRTVIA